ncbi:MAG: serine/threonine-protein kinase [Phycisphaerales bacterium]|nr:serine/threonine protein kinase [Planctomycetota bacterium]MCH8510000.1 serine/threonine-protein kinase [Phycisphaerales bacterium]
MDRSPKEIATRAGQLTGPERDRFLLEACGRDAALRDAVRRLLAIQDSVTLDSGAGPAGNGSDADTRAGAHEPYRIEAFRAARGAGLPDRVGAYRVLGELGQGAMGVVYLAEQRHPRRKVALKVIRPDAITPERERRFDLEAEALARLRHPGIATIYEAGRADLLGRAHPFFAMELVQGRPLDTHANYIPPRERIVLFLSVCEAVEHAHQRGVLHRDLKPANILVDEDGRARVLDFGVARSLEAGVRTGELVGTVPYMSPEQLAAEPDVDVRTDVYALGVILCEITTGHRPHEVDGMTVDEALDVVSVPPVIDEHAAGPELAAIIARAVTPDRDARYGSVGELAADLRRFLRHEPVHAYANSRWYRTRKLIRRNPVPSALAGAAGLILALGAAGTAWQAAVATRGWNQARAETQRAEAALAQAEAERRRVHAVNIFMTDMLTSADPAHAMGEELTVRELLDITARSLSTELRDQPEIEATVRMALANTYIALGEYPSAQEQAMAMMTGARERLGPAHPMTADAERTLAIVYAETERFAEAEALIRDAIPAVDAMDDRVESARVRGELARVLFVSGRQDEALELWQQAHADLTEAVGPDHEHTLVAVHNTCLALKHAGRLTEAEALARDLLQRRRERLGPNNPQTLGTIDLLGGMIMAQGREREALPYLREVLEGRSRILGEDHLATMLTMGNLGATLVRLGELDEAESLTRRSLEAHTRRLGREHARTITLLGNLAYLLEDRGRPDEAAEIYREIIAIRARNATGPDPESWGPRNNLAMLLAAAGRHEEADAIYAELLAACDAALPPGHYLAALFRNNHADTLIALERPDAARAALDASHPVIEAVFGADHERTQRSLDRRARLESLLQR